MGALLQGVSACSGAIHRVISVAGERESNGNIYAIRALDGVTRIIRSMGATFFGAEALVHFQSALRPAISLYGAFTSVFYD